MMDDDRLSWAEALEIERLHGDDGPRWIAKRIGEAVRSGGTDGMTRYCETALRYAGLLGAATRAAGSAA